MGSRRTMILVVAIVIAAVAAVATFSYLNGVQSRANKGAALVKVWVVKKDIQKGFPAEEAIGKGFLKEDSIQDKFRPATSVTDLNAIKGKVALTNLSANQVLVDGQFVDPKVEQITNSQRIQPGRVAVTLSIDQVHGVGGLLVPGDKVNVMVTDAGPNAQAAERTLFQNVEILFIGTNAAPQPGETQAATNPGSGLITFSVPALAAEKLVFASQNGGNIYLALVPPDNQPTPIPPVGYAELFSGGLTPYEG